MVVVPAVEDDGKSKDARVLIDTWVTQNYIVIRIIWIVLIKYYPEFILWDWFKAGICSTHNYRKKWHVWNQQVVREISHQKEPQID